MTLQGFKQKIDIIKFKFGYNAENKEVKPEGMTMRGPIKSICYR